MEVERVTLNIRVIRSFEYRNIRIIILKNVSLTSTGAELRQLIDSQITSYPGLPPPVRKYDYDTLKVSYIDL